MNRSSHWASSLGIGLALTALSLTSLPSTLRGQELPWLPKGRVRLDFAPTLWAWDSRYGLDSSGTEGVEFLGMDLTGNPLGSDLLPDLRDLEASLRDALDDPSYRIQLGVSQATIDQQRLVFPLRLEIGVTDWLTVGGMVPFVRPRQEILFALDADSLTATDGYSPFTTDANGVLSFLDALRVAVLDAEAAFPSEQSVLDARTYLDAMNSAYSQGTFFPILGSGPGIRLQERLDELRAAFGALGITGLPQTVPLGDAYLTEEDFQTYMGSPSMRSFPLEDFTALWTLGDAEITANVRLLRGGFEPDSLGELPNIRYQLGGGLLVRLGTGDQEDPARFFDQDAGDGQMDFEGNVFGLLELGARFGAWGQMRYGVQTEGDIYRRIAAPSETLPAFLRTVPTKWTPGDYFELDLNPRFFLDPALSFGIRYHFWRKGEDTYALGAINPDFQDPALLPPIDLLNQETEQTLQEVGLSATFSSVEAHARGKASMPLYIRATYFRPISGSGGQMPKGERFQVGLTIFKTLWGGPDSSPEELPGMVPGRR